MEPQISITWVNPALTDLQTIFDFYAQQSAPLAERVIDRVDVLTLGFLEIGQLEPLLTNHPGRLRYLIEGNYKLIYRIVDDSHVLILTVFDVRQGPGRLVNRFI